MRLCKGIGKDVDDDERSWIVKEVSYQDCEVLVRVNEKSLDVAGGAHADDPES